MTNLKTVRRMLRNVKRMTLAELKEQGDTEFKKAQEREASLIEAYDNKKLKSEALKKEARAIKKARAQAAEKAAKKKEKAAN